MEQKIVIFTIDLSKAEEVELEKYNKEGWRAVNISSVFYGETLLIFSILLERLKR